MKLKIFKTDDVNKDTSNVQVGLYNISLSGFDNIILNNNKFKLLLSGDIYDSHDELSNSLYNLIGNATSAFEVCKQVKSIVDGRYAFILIDNNKKDIFVSNDKFGRQDIFYVISEFAHVSGELASLKSFNKSGFDNFGVAHTIITTTGARAPKKHTAFNDVKRIGLNQILKISDDSATIKQYTFSSKKYIDYDSSYLKKHTQIFLETIEKLGSVNENIVYLSSGWDSTAILASLNHVFGNKKVKAVTWRFKISDRSGVFNKFEIERAEKFCDYFDIPLHIVDTDYVEDGALMYDEVHPFLNKYGYYPFTSFSHYYTAKKSSEIKEFDDSVLFSGEISDGAYNLGFSQYISTFHPSPGFREYSDKMLCYLYGPTFLKECLKGSGDTDPIYQFFKGRYKGKLFDQISSNEETLVKQILHSFFGRNERFPFLSIKNNKFLTLEGMNNYSQTLENEYFNDLSGFDVDNIYSLILYLYNSFHWNGSSVNTLYSAAEHHGMRLRVPYYDPKLQDFLEQMPENWGRGLDLNHVKYPLKYYLANEIDYPLNLQSGPHSYLYDIDADYLNPPHEWLMYSMNSTYNKAINNFDIDTLDNSYFNTEYFRTIIADYQCNDIKSENFSPLYGLLNFILTESRF